MNKTIPTLAAIMMLTACANSAGEYGESAIQQWDKMKAATNAAQPDFDRCAHGRKASEVPRKDFVKYMVCYSDVEEAKVLPVVNYPDLYHKAMAIRSENASLYAQGKIDFEQFKARWKLSMHDFVDEAVKRTEATYRAYAAQDEQENAAIREGFASFKQAPTTRTSCFSTGMATNCTSRTSNY